MGEGSLEGKWKWKNKVEVGKETRRGEKDHEEGQGESHKLEYVKESSFKKGRRGKLTTSAY